LEGLRMFPSSVTIAHKQSIDAHHVITYGTAQTVSCRYQEMITKITDQNGNEIMTSGWAQFPKEVSISEEDQITLPDGSKPKIATLQRIYDHLGRLSCTEIYLSKEGGFS
jgi:hypothetical protein